MADFERQPLAPLPLSMLETKIRQFSAVTDLLAGIDHDFKYNPGQQSRKYDFLQTQESGVFNPAQHEISKRHGLTGIWSIRATLFDELTASGFQQAAEEIIKEVAEKYKVNGRT